MQPTAMNGSKMQTVGRLTLYIRPDGSLVATMGSNTTPMVVTPDEAQGLFDYLLSFARLFEQASNGHRADTEPLRLERAQEKESEDA